MIYFSGGISRFHLAALALFLVALCGCGCADQQSKTDIAASTNTAPVITTITASPSVVTRGGSAHIIVSATDAEGDDLTYSYSATAGTCSPDGNLATWTAPPTPGKYIVTVTISDGHHKSEAWVVLTVFVPLTSVTGTLVLPTGETGDLSNTRMFLRAGATSAATDTLVRQIPVVVAGRLASFSIENIQPGSYYLEAWQDTDHNNRLSAGDLYGCYGGAGHPGMSLPPLTLAEGETRFVRIQMSAFTALPEEGTDSGGQDNQGKKGKGELTTATESRADQ